MRLTDNKSPYTLLPSPETQEEIAIALLQERTMDQATEIKYVKAALGVGVALTTIALIELATVDKNDTHTWGVLTFLIMGTTITVAATSLKLFADSNFFNR
jgi:hypothetical protein